MVQAFTREMIAQRALIHSHPVLRNAPVDRSFELPPVLYAAMVGLFLGFLGVMWLGFANPQLILPMAIFVAFIVCGFGVPALWVRMPPENPVQAKTWDRFRAEGIQTYTGRTSARDATVQMLMLPALIFAWGVATATIAALV
ncbi:hypothetical protein [Altericroceibacterium xinjiangense]|uniref:hypothetical protein n=1 Tax=Altericroceibacterium xinjiangense TaxID=762261 RepID=UPI000F7ED830|nr:hypothetical protein [Altericroceibacterium xinjiangense]